MDVILLLLGMFIVFLGFSALRKIERLQTRLSLLESRLTGTQTGYRPAPATAPEAQPIATATAPPVQREGAPSPPPPAPVDVPPPTTLPGMASLSTPKPAPVFSFDMEQMLGARLSLWLGAIAIIAGGGFLVKYSIDNDLLSPLTRVILGCLGGLALIGGSPWMERHANRAAAAMVTGGVGMLYGSLFAATNLYGLLPSWLGLIVLSIVTACAVGMALRHGQIVAFVALAGGMVTPLMLPSENPSPLALFGYLALLQAGIAAIARRQDWPYLLAATATAGLLWAFAATVSPPAGYPVSGVQWLYLFAVVGIYVFATGLPGWRLFPTASLHRRAVVTASVAVTLVCALILARSPADWHLLLLLVLLAWTLERFDTRHEGLALGGVIAPGLALLWWSEPAGTMLAHGLTGGLGLAVIAFIAGWRTPRALYWFSLSGFITLVTLLLLWYRLPADSVPWGKLCIVLALAYLSLLTLVMRDGPMGANARLPLACTITGLIALAVPFELSRPWMPMAWTVQVAAMAWLERHLGAPPLNLPFKLGTVPALRFLALGLTVIALLQLVSVAVGGHRHLSSEGVTWLWLLFGHGVPVLALAAAAILFADRGDDRWAFGLEVLAVGLIGHVLLLAVLLLWHGAIVWRLPDMVGTATLGIAWMLYGIGLIHFARAWPRRVVIEGGDAFVLAGIVAVLILAHIVAFPARNALDLGEWPVLNLLLWTTGVPAALAFGTWRARRGRPGDEMDLLLPGAGLFLLFMLVTLQVRHAFHDGMLYAFGTGVAENYAYSLAWLLFGGTLMVPGVLRGSRALRYAALGVLVLAVGKVFLYDASNLEGLYRAASFLGLGLGLIALGFVYQRFVRPA